MGTVILSVSCLLLGVLLGGLLAVAGSAEQRADCLACHREKQLMEEQLRRYELDGQLQDTSLRRLLEAMTLITDKAVRAGTLRIH